MSASNSLASIHATCIAWKSYAALLCGASGSGKSDLALRFLSLGEEACLVADDQVELQRKDDRIIARAPAALAGLLEVRGLGLWRVPALASAEVAIVVNLVPRDAVPRLPESQFAALIGVGIPALALHAFDASAPVKLRLALQTISGMSPQMIRERGFPGWEGKFG